LVIEIDIVSGAALEGCGVVAKVPFAIDGSTVSGRINRDNRNASRPPVQ
jgi:hypothetical protein